MNTTIIARLSQYQNYKLHGRMFKWSFKSNIEQNLQKYMSVFKTSRKDNNNASIQSIKTLKYEAVKLSYIIRSAKQTAPHSLCETSVSLLVFSSYYTRLRQQIYYFKSYTLHILQVSQSAPACRYTVKCSVSTSWMLMLRYLCFCFISNTKLWSHQHICNLAAAAEDL